jgi:hypothetical protein
MQHPVNYLIVITLRLVAWAIFFCDLFVLSLYTIISFTQDEGLVVPIQQPPWLKYGLLALIPTLLILAIVLYWPDTKRVTAIPSRRYIYRRVFTALSVLFFCSLFIDTTAPVQRYTAKDVTPQDSSSLQSTRLLDILYSSGTQIPDLKYIHREGELATIEQYTDEIQAAWEEIASLREAVQQLTLYGRALHHPEQYSEKHEIGVIKLAAIYQAHALLLARQGAVDLALAEMSLFHSVGRKGLEGSVSLLQKMVWISVIRRNLQTVLQIVWEYQAQGPQYTPLLEVFAPITPEEASFFKPWIGEYLRQMSLIDCSFMQTVEARISEPEKTFFPYILAGKLPEPVVELLYKLTLQKKRTATTLTSFWEQVIDHSRTTPVKSFAVVDVAAFYGTLPLRNLGGWYLHQPPLFLNYEGQMARLRAESDLIAAYLRYGREEGSDTHRLSSGKREPFAANDGKLFSRGEERRYGLDKEVILEVLYRHL